MLKAFISKYTELIRKDFNKAHFKLENETKTI